MNNPHKPIQNGIPISTKDSWPSFMEIPTAKTKDEAKIPIINKNAAKRCSSIRIDFLKLDTLSFCRNVFPINYNLIIK